MKKICMILFVMLLFFSVSITSFANEAKVTVDNVDSTEPGLIKMVLYMSDCEKADTIGIKLNYDSALLSMNKNECKWEKKGVLDNFDSSKKTAVWTTEKAQDLNGKLCTFCFTIKDGAQAEDIKVDFEVIVKSGSTKIGTYRSESTIKLADIPEVPQKCNHQNIEYHSISNMTHESICKDCGEIQKLSHEWDAGIIIKESTSKSTGLKRVTCKLCGGTIEVIIPIGEKDVMEDDYETSGKMVGTVGNNNNNNNNNQNGFDYSQDNQFNYDEHEGHDHTAHQDGVNIIDSSNISDDDIDSHTHTGLQTHDSEEENNSNKNNNVIIYIIIALILVGIVAFIIIGIKRKR